MNIAHFTGRIYQEQLKGIDVVAWQINEIAQIVVRKSTEIH